MKNKVIASILLGSMLLAGCSSTKTTKTTKNPNVNDPTDVETSIDETDETDETDVTKETSEKSHDSKVYYINEINKDEVYKIIDAVYAGSPQKGENVETITRRVEAAVGKDCASCSLFSGGGDICIEYGSIDELPNDGGIIKGRDNLCCIRYNNFRIDWAIENKAVENATILGNKQSYTAPEYPGDGAALFHIFDEEKATELYKVLCGYIDDNFQGYSIGENKAWNGYAAMYDTSKVNKYIAIASMVYDEHIGCWIVYYAAKFESIGVVDKNGNPIPEEDEKAIHGDQPTVETTEVITADGATPDQATNEETKETTVTDEKGNAGSANT